VDSDGLCQKLRLYIPKLQRAERAQRRQVRGVVAKKRPQCVEKMMALVIINQH
jgi:hypothetical protein